MEAHRKKSFARWGLLVTTATMGISLVAASLGSYVVARQASDSVLRARSLDMMHAVRRGLRDGDEDLGRRLDEVVAEMEEQGLRYVAIVDRRGDLVADGGEPSAPLGDLGDLDVGRDRGPVVLRQGDRVRAIVGPRRGEGRRWREKVPRQRGERWRTKLKRDEPPLQRWGKGMGWGRRLLVVVEFEPVVARSITSQALLMLAASLAAAVLLLGATLVFWRQSLRAEEMEAQLARDRHLKSLGEVSAVLGHEIRNPLASLKGHAQLLVERLDEEHPGRKGADRIVLEAERLEALTSQILDFVRTAAVVRAPTDPRAVATSAIEACGETEVRLLGDQDLPRWPMDRDRMERVLVNLVGNAASVSPADAAVELTVATEGKGRLVYTVRDRGPGIGDGEEEWIFEPFHTKKVKGTGLGLAVAKRIVEAHGGGISASNHPEGGAVFRVWIPRVEEG